MTEPLIRARSIGGLILIVTLAAMLIIELIYPGLHIPPRSLAAIVPLIAALLGVDVFLTRYGTVLKRILEIIQDWLSNREDDD